MCVSKCHVLDVSSFSRTWQPWIFNTKISQCTAKPLGKIVESTRTETSTSHVCRPCPSEAAPRQGPSPKELLGNKVGLDGFGWAWMGLDGFGGENFLMGSNPSETYECLGFIIPNWKDKNTLKKTYLSWLDKGVTYQLGCFQHLPLVTPGAKKQENTVDGNPMKSCISWYSRWFFPLFVGFQPSKVMQDFFHPQ